MTVPGGNGLVILAKEPVPGRVKSRLARDISAERAATLYRAFILDTLAICSRVAGATGWIAYTPDDAGEVFASLGEGRFRLLPQGGGDLGDRLGRVFGHLFEGGCRRVVVLGSDSPTLPPRIVQDAFRALEEKEVAIGPCLDGGYYLLGLTAPLPGILEGISWGTETVLAETVERVRISGRSLAFLPPWYDVDTVSDLGLLRAQIEGIRLSGGTELPQHTDVLLRGMGSTGSPNACASVDPRST